MVKKTMRPVGAASMTSSGWPVSSAAQSRNEDRNPCSTAAVPRYWSMLGSDDNDTTLQYRRPFTKRFLVRAYNTHSVILRNAGRRPATNVRLSHYSLPDFSVWP